MNTLVRLTTANLKSFTRDRAAMFWTLAFPLVFILLFGAIFSGGGVSKFDAIYTEGVAEVSKHLFSGKLETPIVKHQLGDSAGVIGAALIGV